MRPAGISFHRSSPLAIAVSCREPLKPESAVVARAGDTCAEKAGLSKRTADERLALSVLDSACAYRGSITVADQGAMLTQAAWQCYVPAACQQVSLILVS